MLIRKAFAMWAGTLQDGHGKMSLGSGAFDGIYSLASRFEHEKGTSPEEFLGAAYAGCFSMALAQGLTEAGYAPDWVQTWANVYVDQGEGRVNITGIELTTTARVPEIDGDTFLEHAEMAKDTCPVSHTLSNIPISLEAKFIG
jgi:osmotically inducible protein OsmC